MNVGDRVKLARMTELITGITPREGTVISINDFRPSHCVLVEFDDIGCAWFSPQQLEILNQPTQAYLELFT